MSRSKDNQRAIEFFTVPSVLAKNSSFCQKYSLTSRLDNGGKSDHVDIVLLKMI